jgi:hypothetical protein
MKKKILEEIRKTLLEYSFENEMPIDELMAKIVWCEECKIINTEKCIYAVRDDETNEYKTDVKLNDYCYHGKK